MIERMKAIEASATPGPWTNAEVWCDQNSDSDSTTGYAQYDKDAKFIAAFRNLAPELLALWEASNRLGGELHNMDEAHSRAKAFNAALDALNAKTAAI